MLVLLKAVFHRSMNFCVKYLSQTGNKKFLFLVLMNQQASDKITGMMSEEILPIYCVFPHLMLR